MKKTRSRKSRDTVPLKDKPDLGLVQINNSIKDKPDLGLVRNNNFLESEK